MAPLNKKVELGLYVAVLKLPIVPPPLMRVCPPNLPMRSAVVLLPPNSGEVITLCGSSVNAPQPTPPTSPMPCTVPFPREYICSRHERSELAEQIYLSADNWPKRGLGAEPQACRVVREPHEGSLTQAERQTKQEKRNGVALAPHKLSCFHF